jgi:serine/threonine protein kinase/TPR repeat protein
VKPLSQPLRDGDPKSFQGWTLKGFIAEGGQSTIYLAEKNGERAALKMIRKEYLANQKSTDRFFTEIKNLERLDHPNISRVLEVEDSGKFLAIEFIDGPNLEDHVKESGPLEVQQWVTLAQILASTVDYCHSQGIIHKDISPRNIVIGPKGPVLVDFGISYLEKDERLTSDGETIGTPPFMSPEHFGITAPKQMDVFCLGGTLIFAATGHYPFNGTNSAEWRDAILFSSPDFVGLSVEQISLLSPLLYKKPEDRGSLENFSKLLSELSSSNWESELHAKEFARIKRESQYKLIQEKKQLAVKNQTFKKSIAGAAIVSLLSIGLVASGVFAIQNNSGENNTKSSNPTGTSSSLTPDQLTQLSACKDFAGIGDYEAAIRACKEIAELGDAWAQYSLGVSLEQPKEAEIWVRKAADQKLPEALVYLASLEINRKNYSEALAWATQAADLGSLDGVNYVGVSYGYLKKYDLAVEWYKKSWQLGDVLGAINLGYHYRFDDYDKDEAEKWLKIAAETKSAVFEGDSAYAYAEFLRVEIKNESEACQWYKKSADANYEEGEENGKEAFKKYCPNFVDVQKKIKLPSPKTTVSTPVVTNKPNPSSESFKVSAPLAPNVQRDEIFGRPFENGLNFWQISLTNVKGEKVPEITAVQFRMIGYPNAGWMDVPYKLRTDTSFGNVYAEVDDLLFALMFKEVKYCPEFRVVREEGGKIVQIWNKGQPDCATDYNP